MMVNFTKMHGAGNDFIVVDEWKGEVVPQVQKEKFVKSICDRRFGIGSDVAIFVQKSKVADVNFAYYNPDGSRAEMCGNGIRCLAKFVFEHGLIRRNVISAETRAGTKQLELTVVDGIVYEVKVDMGRPQVSRGEAQVSGDPDGKFVNQRVSVGGADYDLTAVGMGNPHTVMFCDNVDAVDVAKVGAAIRNHTPLSPKGTNVHFLQHMGGNEFRIRTFERGVEAETLACGTGICASAVAAVLNDKADMRKPILFEARGGNIKVELEGTKDDIRKAYLIGSAEEVYTGSIEL